MTARKLRVVSQRIQWIRALHLPRKRENKGQRRLILPCPNKRQQCLKEAWPGRAAHKGWVRIAIIKVFCNQIYSKQVHLDKVSDHWVNQVVMTKKALREYILLV